MRHPAIQPILEVVPDGERVLLVAEDAGLAQRLNEVMQHRSPTFEETARWLSEIAEGIQHGHERGIELLDLMWFDISIRDDGHAIMTEPARWLFAIVGLPEIYGNISPPAPELLTGQSRGDRRSVVYSLGVICYRLMTGVMPFKEEGPERIQKILHDVPPSPRRSAARSRKSWNPSASRRIATKPEDRYASPGELRSRFEVTLNPSRGRGGVSGREAESVGAAGPSQLSARVVFR